MSPKLRFRSVHSYLCHKLYHSNMSKEHPTNPILVAFNATRPPDRIIST